MDEGVSEGRRDCRDAQARPPDGPQLDRPPGTVAVRVGSRRVRVLRSDLEAFLSEGSRLTTRSEGRVAFDDAVGAAAKAVRSDDRRSPSRRSGDCQWPPRRSQTNWTRVEVDAARPRAGRRPPRPSASTGTPPTRQRAHRWSAPSAHRAIGQAPANARPGAAAAGRGARAVGRRDAGR